MRILGIDPGYAILGWSVIEKDLKLINYGTIETHKDKCIEDRILEIHNALTEILNKYKPQTVAIERLFFSKNTKTAIDVAKTIGAIILTVKMHGLELHEYQPNQVKIALTGYGRASKEQMQTMVKTIFNLKKIPTPDDAADALAIAASHSFKL